MKNERGQVLLILILVMTVALAIGIAVIQRSLSDISTSSKVEQSSRAFSAAEAGIEKAIQGDTSVTTTDLGNSSAIRDVQKNNVPDQGAQNQGLEYPAIAKEELAQVWLANPDDLSTYYNQSSINIYWGLAGITTDKPALEITIISLSGGTYQARKVFLDSDSFRISSNHFDDANTGCASGCTSGCTNFTIPSTSLGANRTFLCRTTITGLSPVLILLRARILYSNLSQPFAVQPNCYGWCPLPVQGRLYISTGVSGQTQRKIQVFRLDKVVPPYFDYAIFSAGTISK